METLEVGGDISDEFKLVRREEASLQVLRKAKDSENEYEPAPETPAEFLLTVMKSQRISAQSTFRLVSRAVDHCRSLCRIRVDMDESHPNVKECFPKCSFLYVKASLEAHNQLRADAEKDAQQE